MITFDKTNDNKTYLFLLHVVNSTHCSESLGTIPFPPTVLCHLQDVIDVNALCIGY